MLWASAKKTKTSARTWPLKAQKKTFDHEKDIIDQDSWYQNRDCDKRLLNLNDSKNELLYINIVSKQN